jgi:hypothetical protein
MGVFFCFFLCERIDQGGGVVEEDLAKTSELCCSQSHPTKEPQRKKPQSKKRIKVTTSKIQDNNICCTRKEEN